MAANNNDKTHDSDHEDKEKQKYVTQIDYLYVALRVEIGPASLTQMTH